MPTLQQSTSTHLSGLETPKQLGYSFPAEFAPHVATWLSWPHKEASWPGKIHTIFPSYCQFIKELTKGEIVRINVVDESMKKFAIEQLQKAEVDLSKVEFYFHPTNDAWCRDHGPALIGFCSIYFNYTDFFFFMRCFI